MHIQHFFDDATATLTYLVHDGDHGIVIDPIRDYDPKSARTSWAGSERVAAANSYSSGMSCSSGYGEAVRVSAHESFIGNYLSTTPAPVTCTTCRTLASTTFGGCSTEALACATGTECGNFLSCADACAPTDSACIQACGTQHARGSFDYRTLYSCSCADCPTECGSDASCDQPACGHLDPTA